MDVDYSDGDEELNQDCNSSDDADEGYDEESSLDTADDEENTEQTFTFTGTRKRTKKYERWQIISESIEGTQHLAPTKQLYTEFLG